MGRKRKTYCRGFKAGVEYMRRIDRMHEQIKRAEPEPETNVIQFRVRLPRNQELAEYLKAMLDLLHKPEGDPLAEYLKAMLDLLHKPEGDPS